MKHYRLISIISFLIFYPPSLPAQTLPQNTLQTDTKQEATETDKPVPEKKPGIPMIEISGRAQKTRIALNKISANLEPDANILIIKQQFPSFLSSMKRQRSGWFYESLKRLPTRKLDELSQKWNIHLNKLKNWDNKLAEHSRKLEEDSIQLEEMAALWQLTSEAVIGEETPDAIKERIKSTIDMIEEIKTRLSEEMKVSLTLQDQISEQQLKVKKLISMINDAEAQSRKQLFSRDNLPLWKAIQDREDILNFGSQIRDSVARSLRLNMVYFQANTGRLSLHIIIFSALLGLMTYFYRHNKRNRLFGETDAALKASAFFISYPFSTALLISIFFSIWIYTNSPHSVNELRAFLVLIPVLRLARKIVTSELHKLFYFLTGLFILTILEDIIGDYILLQRLLLFLITIIAIPLFAWWLRPRSPVYLIKSSLSHKLTIRFSIFMLTLLLASLVTNVIGIFPLGHVLVSGMMRIIYFSVAIYVIGRVLDVLVALFIRRRCTQAFHIVQTYSRQLERNTIFFIHLFVYFVWIRMVLKTFGLYVPLWNWLWRIAEYQLKLGTLKISTGAVFSSFIILAIAFVLARIIRIILEMEIFPRLRLTRGVPGAISMMVRYTIIGFGFFLAISAAGFDLGKFGLLAGAMGVGLGFGLRNIIENFVSGLILIFERPIQVGDTVEVGDVVGNVQQMGIRSSTVKTFDGSEVIVPNANLLSNQVTNWTMSDRRRRIKLPVKVAFGNDPHKVLELLREVAGEHQGVLKNPEPMAIFSGFGDNYLEFMLYYWVSDNIFQTMSEIALGVHDTIKEAGIDTPRPKGDFNLKFINTPDKSRNNDK